MTVMPISSVLIMAATIGRVAVAAQQRQGNRNDIEDPDREAQRGDEIRGEDAGPDERDADVQPERLLLDAAR